MATTAPEALQQVAAAASATHSYREPGRRADLVTSKLMHRLAVDADKMVRPSIQHRSLETEIKHLHTELAKTEKRLREVLQGTWREHSRLLRLLAAGPRKPKQQLENDEWTLAKIVLAAQERIKAERDDSPH